MLAWKEVGNRFLGFVVGVILFLAACGVEQWLEGPSVVASSMPCQAEAAAVNAAQAELEDAQEALANCGNPTECNLAQAEVDVAEDTLIAAYNAWQACLSQQ